LTFSLSEGEAKTLYRRLRRALRRARLTEEDEERIVELRKEGWSYGEIAKEVGFSEATIWKVLKKRGVIE